MSIKSRLAAAAVIGAIAAMGVSAQAEAGQRYATPPPLTLSPNLTSPWMLQLKPKRRVANRAQRRATQRPRRLKRLARQKWRAPSLPQRHRAALQADRRTTGSLATTRLRMGQDTGSRADLLPATVSWRGGEKAGTVVVNTIERRLYLILPGGEARRYAIGVGKPGFEWAGTHRVSRKAEWPSWTPPKEMIARERKKGRELPSFMPGGPENPMGARALYLGSTIYRIHGTNQAWSIGHAVSSGCIRMLNEDVMDLYERVPVGARVKVI